MKEDVSRTPLNPLGRTVSRVAATGEDGHVVTLYRFEDGPLKTRTELADELEAEAAGLPPEQWVGGEFNVNDYIIEAVMVGIYDSVQVIATVVTRYVDGSTVSFLEYSDEDVVVAERRIKG